MIVSHFLLLFTCNVQIDRDCKGWMENGHEKKFLNVRRILMKPDPHIKNLKGDFEHHSVQAQISLK